MVLNAMSDRERSSDVGDDEHVSAELLQKSTNERFSALLGTLEEEFLY